MSLFNDPNYVPPIKITLSEREAVTALRDAWNNFFGSYPSSQALAILTAQSCLETGRWREIMNNNFGNLKKIDGQKFTMFATGENIYNAKLKKTEWHWFEPPHIQTAFRSYTSPEAGARDYIEFLADRKSSETWRNNKYKEAFEYLKAGNPEKFSYALHEAGYYTANPKTYTDGVIRIYNEFLNKISDWFPENHVPPEKFNLFNKIKNKINLPSVNFKSLSKRINRK